MPDKVVIFPIVHCRKRLSVVICHCAGVRENFPAAGPMHVCVRVGEYGSATLSRIFRVLMRYAIKRRAFW